MHHSLRNRGPEATSELSSVHAPRLMGLVGVSVLAGLLWIARAMLVGPRFSFLGWNLFLAWVPWLLSLALPKLKGPVFGGALLAWLAFFPNAPYLLTDLVHLSNRPPVPMWFDVLFLSTFAWAGCLLGWDSLWRTHLTLIDRVGAKWSVATVTACIWLCGLGVFLGRFERLNSWELVTEPTNVMSTVVAVLFLPKTMLFSVAFGAFVGVGYLFTRPAAQGMKT